MIENKIRAVFDVIGPLPTEIQEAGKFVSSEWLPNVDSNYEVKVS